MATQRAQKSDKGIGVTLALGTLTLVAAGYTFVAPTQELTAWGFAAAVTLAVLTVAALHVWPATENR
ncbi:MAG: hypothetical protein ABEJ08_05410 [Halobacteriaceae archaeon]